MVFLSPFERRFFDCLRSHFGLSETSFSLKAWSAGSWAVESDPMWRGRRVVGAVGGVEPEVHQERRLRGSQPVDELDRLVSQHIGLVLARLVAVELELGRVGGRGLLDQLVVEVEGALGDLPVPLVPRGRDRQRRRQDPGVAVQVLADVEVVVARVLGPDRKRVRLLGPERVPSAERRDVASDQMVVHVLAGQQARPRRAAEGIGDVAAPERRPLRPDQRLHVRHRRELVRGLVVGEDEDDVVAGGGLGVVGVDAERYRACGERGDDSEGHRFGTNG